MHETVIAQNIITEAERHGHVTRIVLEIGELAPVPGHELIETLQRLKSDWEIVWSEVPSAVLCGCGYAGHPTVLERGHDSFMIECPACSEMPNLVGGTEIKIVSVRVD